MTDINNLDLLYFLIRILFCISGILIICMLICQQIRNSHWMVRWFDFPAKQVLIVHSLISIIFFGYGIAIDEAPAIWAILVSTIPITVLLILIFPYTPVSPVEVIHDTSGDKADLSILMANVYMENRKFKLIKELIEKHDPDCILLTEPDLAWANSLEDLSEKYPYHILHPLENTYGLLFYSKLKYKNPEVRFILKDDVPSLRLQLEIRPGEYTWFYGVHPEPPSPTESKTSLPRDIELLKMAKEVKEHEGPTLLMGDLNDVAWSHTTRLFRRYSGMLDPRIGRGTFDTFHAKYPWFRWPLDHCFVSKHFVLNDMRVLPDIGSDHFPVLIRVSLTEELQTPPDASSEDIQEVEEKLAQEVQ